MTYQWLANNVRIPGAGGSSYTLGEGKLGRKISVMATYTDDRGNEDTLTSGPTEPVAARERNSRATGLPLISGRALVGQTLTGGHVAHLRRGRPGEFRLVLPVGGGRRQHPGGDRPHIHAGASRRGQGDHGNSKFLGRRGIRTVHDQPGHDGGDHGGSRREGEVRPTA